jgi:hypothetical protein
MQPSAQPVGFTQGNGLALGGPQAPQRMVVFMTPCLSSHVSMDFHMSMLTTEDELNKRGISRAHVLRPGDPYLAKVRSKMASDFLRDYPAADSLFFIDDDVGWPAQKAVDFVRYDKDIVGGIYPKKTDNNEWPVQLDMEGGRPVEENGLVRVMLAPTGFLCIKRPVLEQMAAKAGQYLNTVQLVNPAKHWNIFDMGFFLPDGTRPYPMDGRVGEFWGEDYYFCRKWRDMGGHIWIDPDIEFTHTGKKTWRGNFKVEYDKWRATLTQQVEQPKAAE